MDIKDIIFYGSYISFLILFISIFLFIKKRSVFVGWIILFTLLFIYARFIEPQIIIKREREIEVGFSSQIALISDLHIWKYKWKNFLKRIVKEINSLDVEYIFIAWDLTYEPDVEQLRDIFSPLSQSSKKVFWVLGNHDVERPGPKLREELIEAMDYENIVFLNNQVVSLSEFNLVWLGSHWNNEDDTKILDTFSEQDNVVTLLHNPDSVNNFPEGLSDITFAGHTHGGQIRIPFLYKKVIPTVWDFDRGYSVEDTGKLYISSGVWEIGLPLRFLNPPVIDIITLY